MPFHPSTHRISRRRAVAAAATTTALGATGLALAGTSARAQGATAGATPPAATPAPSLSGDDPLDATVLGLMSMWALPGAQLAVGFDGRLVVSRAYGLADVETAAPVELNHRFRIASVSKALTALGVMRLLQAGQLALDDLVFPLLALEPPAGAVPDPRLDTITVEHLLTHAGGWDSSVSGDPQYPPISQFAAATLGEPGPPSAESIIRFMLGSPLDFDPGSAWAYSNFGFNVLGRVIERASGLTYADFMQQEVFGPAGATSLAIGGTTIEDRAENEVTYHPTEGYPATVPSVYPGVGFLPMPYGAYYMEGLDAHGGWIATASDLVRVALAIDGADGNGRGDALLEADTVETMVDTDRPPARGAAGAGNASADIGLGWVVREGPLGSEWTHSGALAGSNSSYLLRTPDGLAIAFLANALPIDYPAYFGEMIPALVDAAAGITTWPDVDLFEN